MSGMTVYVSSDLLNRYTMAAAQADAAHAGDAKATAEREGQQQAAEANIVTSGFMIERRLPIGWSLKPASARMGTKEFGKQTAALEALRDSGAIFNLFTQPPAQSPQSEAFKAQAGSNDEVNKPTAKFERFILDQNHHTQRESSKYYFLLRMVMRVLGHQEMPTPIGTSFKMNDAANTMHLKCGYAQTLKPYNDVSWKWSEKYTVLPFTNYIIDSFTETGSSTTANVGFFSLKARKDCLWKVVTYAAQAFFGLVIATFAYCGQWKNIPKTTCMSSFLVDLPLGNVMMVLASLASAVRCAAGAVIHPGLVYHQVPVSK
ncbi:MAG: hypothetical protein H0X51_02440 [Parachlamydiaceae bacterium]|nr:hypothetical protein [Parachlamydiaceae bacterium]